MSAEPRTDAPDLSPVSEEGGSDTDRVVFFSDAIFAIAMTVIAVTLDIPHIDMHEGSSEILDILRYEWPMYVAYFLSFWVVAHYWIGHFRFFRRVSRWDAGMIVRNILLLFLVGFVPHPTRLVGEYGAEEAAVIIYAATLAALGLVWWDLRRHTISRGLMKSRADAEFAIKNQLTLFLIPVVFIVSMLIAIWNPTMAMATWAVLVIFPYLLVRIRKSTTATAFARVSKAG